MNHLNYLLLCCICIAISPRLKAQAVTTDSWDRDALLAAARSPSGEIQTPGEFEPQDAVWLAWPAYNYEADLLMSDLTAEIIRQLEPYVAVKLLVWDADMRGLAESILAAKEVPTHHLTIIEIPYDEPWLRDMGPVFVVSDEQEKQMVDFNFNGWGNYLTSDEYPRIEEPVDRLIADYLNLQNNMTRLVGEGGNREFNGKGVMMSVAPTELQRNPNMTLEEIEEEFKRLFGINKVIWLPNSLYDDSIASTVYPGPNGEKAYGYGVAHVDELARFADANTIILAEVSEEEALLDTFAYANRQRLEENYEVLKQATDQDGNPFNIIRIPAAVTEFMRITEEDYSHFISSDITMEDGSRGHEGPIWWIPAKSYANFLITNGAVLVASYWREGRPELEREKDEEAVRILESAFPDREIIVFHPEHSLAVNAGGGGIHCITAQEPQVSQVSPTFARASVAAFLTNAPNPFHSNTALHFELPESANITLEVCDLSGKAITTLLTDFLPAGTHQISWDGKNGAGQALAPGIYFARLSGTNTTNESYRPLTRQLLLVK